MSDPHAIPTHIVSGFLGSGKTTTINILLRSLRQRGEDVLVIVNEMGEVGIDAALLEHPERAILELTGGCMCCALRVALETRLAAVLRRWRPSRILIEPTGVGHPQDLLRVIEKGPLAEILLSGPHIVVIDPRLHAQESLRQHPLYQDQWSIADCLALAQTDCSSQEKIDALIDEAEKSGRNWAYGGLAADAALLDIPAHRRLSQGENPMISQAKPGDWHGFRSLHLVLNEQSEALSKARLLCQRLSEFPAPLRVKGVVEEDGQECILQVTAAGMHESLRPASQRSSLAHGITVIFPSDQAIEGLLTCIGPDWRQSL